MNTKNREREIAEVQEEINEIEDDILSYSSHDNADSFAVIYRRILARLQAVLAELRRGMKEGELVMNADEEKVKARWPDAFVQAYDCDCSKTHYRILRRGARSMSGESPMLSMYFDTELEAWAAANLKAAGMKEGSE